MMKANSSISPSAKGHGVSRRTFVKGAAIGAAGLAAAGTVLGGSAAAAAPAASLTVTATACTLLLNGKAQDFPAYLINDNNYLKLRDLAATLNGTAKQFSVSYQAADKTVTLSSGQAYVPVGGELSALPATASAQPTPCLVQLNAQVLDAAAYLINGNNFFKLRDVMAALDVYVGYDQETRQVVLDTSRSYNEEAPATGGSVAPAIGSALSAAGGNADKLWQQKELPPVTPLPVQQFSDIFPNFASMVINPANPYAMPYQGLFEIPAGTRFSGLGLAQRRLLCYIPSSVEYGDRSVFLVLPNDTDGPEFIQRSGWRQLADEEAFFLFVIAPDEAGWQDEVTEVGFLTAAIALAKGRAYTGQHNTCNYFVGYDGGAHLIQRYLLENPTAAAGLVSINGQPIPADYLEQVGSRSANDPADACRTLSQVELPVWMFALKRDQDLARLNAYYRSANHCREACYQLDGDTSVWLQSPYTRHSKVNGDALGQVRQTLGRVDYLDMAFSRRLWQDFFCPVMREATMGVDNLRTYYTREEAGLELHTVQQILGQGQVTRRYYTYVPDSLRQADGSVKPGAPVMFAMHAYFGRFDIYTGWNEVAEEKGAIVIYPVSYPRLQSYTLPCPEWNYYYGPNHIDDMAFLRQALAEVKTRYAIDSSRVYASGQSNGGGITCAMGIALSDILAAVAPVCGTIAGTMTAAGASLTGGAWKWDESWFANYLQAAPMPILISKAQHDMGKGGAINGGDATVTVSYFMYRNLGIKDAAYSDWYQTALNNPTFYDSYIAQPDHSWQNGIFNSVTWNDPAGVPLLQYTLVKDKGHVYTPADAYMVWDFCCQYARRADGAVLYRQDEAAKEVVFTAPK